MVSLRRIHRDATTSQIRRPSDRGNFIFSSPLIPHSSAPMSHQRSSMFPSQIRRLHVLHVRRQAPSSSGRNIWNTQTRVSSVRSANDGASSVADRDRVATMARVGSAVQCRGCEVTFRLWPILVFCCWLDQRAAQWENPEPAEGAGKRSGARPHIPGRDEGCARASTPASTAHAAFDRSRTPPSHSARGVGRRLATLNLGAESRRSQLW